MRRVLAIFLLLLLPLQFGWAAVATYCTHEAIDAKAQHLGHHEHQHLAGDSADAGAGASEGKVAGTLDADCGHCQGTCSGMPVLTGALPDLIGATRPRDAADQAAPAWASSPPERPQWPPLA